MRQRDLVDEATFGKIYQFVFVFARVGGQRCLGECMNKSFILQIQIEKSFFFCITN